MFLWIINYSTSIEINYRKVLVFYRVYQLVKSTIYLDISTRSYKLFFFSIKKSLPYLLLRPCLSPVLQMTINTRPSLLIILVYLIGLILIYISHQKPSLDIEIIRYISLKMYLQPITSTYNSYTYQLGRKGQYIIVLYYKMLNIIRGL